MRRRAKYIAIIAAVALLGLPARAGQAPEKKHDAAQPAGKPTAGEWQVRLNAKVLEWSAQTDLDYGFSIAYWRDLDRHPSSIVGWPQPGGGFAPGDARYPYPDAFLTLPSQSGWDLGLRIFLDQMDAKNGSVEAIIEALEQGGDVRMLAEPTLVLKKGAPKAEVRTGSRIPYASDQVAGIGLAEVTLFQDTGVVLSLAFQDVVQLDDTYAQMKVTASVTSLAGYVTVSRRNGKPRRVPQTMTRLIDNTVLVRDKTTLIAGILKEDSKVSSAQGPPILGDLPFIKHLFRNRSSSRRTREILFLINVELIPPEAT